MILGDEDMTNIHMTKAQAKIEVKAQSTLKSDLFASPVRTAGAGLTKTDAHATYGLRFESYPEPDGRSGTHVPITRYPCFEY